MGLIASALAVPFFIPRPRGTGPRIGTQGIRGGGLLAFAAAAGFASHVLLDLTTAFHTMPLAPFWWGRVALDWTPVAFAPIPSGILALGTLASLAPSARPLRVARGGLLLVGLYLGLCGVQHAVAVAATEAADRSAHDGAVHLGRTEVIAVSRWTDPFGWVGFVQTRGETFEYRIDLLRGTVENAARWDSGYWTISAIRHPWVTAFRRAARVPVLKDVNGERGSRVILTDRVLATLGTPPPYRLTLAMSPAGRVVGARFLDTHVPARVAYFFSVLLLAFVLLGRWAYVTGDP